MTLVDQSFRIRTALISVYNKDERITNLVTALHKFGVQLIASGGTYDYIEKMGIEATKVEDFTHMPSILGGRVKTLHPAILGGILARRNNADDTRDMTEYKIPTIDMVVVDLYPFSEALEDNLSHDQLIEKIDIGGVSLIRACAKNFAHTWVVPHLDYVEEAIKSIEVHAERIPEDTRRRFAGYAFEETTTYDRDIARYICGSRPSKTPLRYGENPHQKGEFVGDLERCFQKLSGKHLSYNNLLDVDAGLKLINEFEVEDISDDHSTFAIIKHSNPCGISSGKNPMEAFEKAFSADPKSAFGGIFVSNTKIDIDLATKIHPIFIEVLIAPAYAEDALEMLSKKKNRVILQSKSFESPTQTSRTILNGTLIQDHDTYTLTEADLKVVTKVQPTSEQLRDMQFAMQVCKHCKSNAVVLAKNEQMLGAGAGLTSRVDALEHAIKKAKEASLDTANGVLASDAFFPYDDCVRIASKAGIKAIIQPGGSIRDQESIDACDELGIAMVFTSVRHFRH